MWTSIPSAWSGRAALADCLGLPATFEQFDIEKEPIRERFDYVLCLNLLHHLRNPLTVLERLAAVTDERLILESATMGRHDRRRLRLSPFETLLLRRRPILYASRNGTSDKRNVQKFFVTPSAIENLLCYQSNAFARVDTQPSDHKNRYISVAHRRRIGELVVVAGATGSGSAELAAQLARGQAPEVAALAGTGDGSGWLHVDANDLAEFSEPAVERLILPLRHPAPASAQREDARPGRGDGRAGLRAARDLRDAVAAPGFRCAAVTSRTPSRGPCALAGSSKGAGAGSCCASSRIRRRSPATTGAGSSSPRRPERVTSWCRPTRTPRLSELEEWRRSPQGSDAAGPSRA